MSIVKNKDQRVAVFVDVQNMYYSARALFDAKLNFKNLMDEVVAGRKLVRANAYVIKADDEEQNPFFEALFKSGFDLRSKDIQIFKGGQKKGDWDVGIAIDAISVADKVDSIILVSGDGDFRPLMDYLKLAKGCTVELVAFEQTTSYLVKEVADDFFNIESDKGKFLIKNRSRRAPSEKRSPGKTPAKRASASRPQNKSTLAKLGKTKTTKPKVRNITKNPKR